ncbi:hypothetical protein Hanom_Chr13g01182521 [Helianthus anomalus]
MVVTNNIFQIPNGYTSSLNVLLRENFMVIKLSSKQAMNLVNSSKQAMNLVKTFLLYLFI